MELSEVRRTILTAVAADDVLVELLVLKGGNALELIHNIGSRSSVDLDFSIEADFDDPAEIARRLQLSLEDRFDAAGFIVFDFAFGPRPKTREQGSLWGGYNAYFKLIDRELATSLNRVLSDMQRQAIAVGPSQQRKFKIEISAFEHVGGRVEADVDHYTCFVYSLEMIAAEKLRAICQQSHEYGQRIHPTARARDFYDIVVVLTEGGVSFEHESTKRLVVEMFRKKNVPLALLGGIETQREFHREEWPRVENAVDRRLREYDYYFNYVLEEIRVLEPLWMIETPPGIV